MAEARGHLVVEVQPRPAGWSVALAGELDVTTADLLRAETGDLVSSGARELVLDVGGLEFCDSVGVSCLVKLRDQCEIEGCAFRLVNVQSYVRRVLLLTGVVEYLNAD